MSLPLLLNTEEACRQIGCGKTFLFELLSKKEIESVLIGNRRKIVSKSLVEYVERLKIKDAA